MNLNNALEWCCKIQNSMGREGVLGHGWTSLGIIVPKLQWNPTVCQYDDFERNLLYFTTKIIPHYLSEYFLKLPIPAAARSKAWTYGSSFAGIAGSNPAEAWTSGSCGCCVLSGWGLLRRNDHSSRGPLLSGVCLSMISKPQRRGGLGCRAMRKEILTISSTDVMNLFRYHDILTYLFLQEQS